MSKVSFTLDQTFLSHSSVHETHELTVPNMRFLCAGVEKVECDQINRKVWVKGSVKPEEVLKKVRKLKKDAELVVQKKQN
jgi:hypothetical protein